MSTSGETIDSDVRRRDRAAEAVYFREEDLKNLRVLARKIRAASATQRGSSLAKEELRHLRDVVPETSAARGRVATVARLETHVSREDVKDDEDDRDDGVGAARRERGACLSADAEFNSDTCFSA